MSRALVRCLERADVPGLQAELERGADPNQRDLANGKTALHLAAVRIAAQCPPPSHNALRQAFTQRRPPPGLFGLSSEDIRLSCELCLFVSVYIGRVLISAASAAAG